MIEKNVSLIKNKVDYLNCIGQISIKCRPVFSDYSNSLFIVCGHNINVYNTKSGDLIGALKGHEHEIIGICKNGEDNLLSCDEQRNICLWEPQSNTMKKFTLAQPESLPSEHTVNYFGLGHGTSIIIGYTSGTNITTNLFFYQSLPSKPIFLTDQILPQTNAVAPSSTSSCIAALRSNELRVMSLLNSGNQISTRVHMSSHTLVNVAYNAKEDPRHDIIAVGDITGAITLYYNVMKQYPIKSVHHWHTLSPNDFLFTMQGKDSELLSGGNENVVVCWRYREDSKRFLPRLGAGIKFLAINKTGTCVIAVHNDRGVSIIEKTKMTLIGMIQSLVHHMPSKGIPAMPIGLVYNSHNRSLIFNGRTGHIQVFNPDTDKLMYNLDITMANIVSNERGKTLSNSEVTRTTFSQDGRWMVTSEVLILGEKYPDIFLKFWQFSEEKQKWELNSAINSPHDDVINGISFSPVDSTTCVTSSSDGSFKIWSLYEQPAIGMQTESRTFWSSFTQRTFRNLSCLGTTFSPDGTVLAVSFGPIITFWTPDEECKYVRCLTRSFLTQNIAEFVFSGGACEGSHLVTRSKDWLCSWDLLSCSLKWTVNISSSCLAVERHSGVMVLFTNDRKMYFFEPHSIKPLKVVSNMRCNVVRSAVFIPPQDELLCEVDVPWRTNSTIHLLDVDQNVLNIQNLDDLDSAVMKSLNKSMKELFSDKKVEKSLYSTLVAQSRHITKAKPAKDFDIAPNSSKLVLQQLLDINVHNLESMETFTPYLSSLVPDIKSREATISHSISYNTIKDNISEPITKGTEDHQSAKSLLATIEAINHINFSSIVETIKKT